jgi:hypothetical protein
MGDLRSANGEIRETKQDFGGHGRVINAMCNTGAHIHTYIIAVPYQLINTSILKLVYNNDLLHAPANHVASPRS